MLVTDGRFSGATRGLMVGHVAPEAVRGGPLAVVREGEQVTVDADAGVLQLDVADDELAARLAAHVTPPARVTPACSAATAASSAPRRRARR